MAKCLLPAFRHVYARPTVANRCSQQRRWARVYDVRFVATRHIQDRIVDRYKYRLEERAKQEGLKDVAELKKLYKDKIRSVRSGKSIPDDAGVGEINQPQVATTSKPDKEAQALSPWPSHPIPSVARSSEHEKAQKILGPKAAGLKTLSSFLDVQKTMDLPPKEIESIWRLRHADNEQSLCAAIPTTVWSSIYDTARKHPQFILPGLPQSHLKIDENSESPSREGAPIHFLQWTFPGPDTVTVLFTHLAEYKLRGEYAQPHTTFTHHLELAQPKGLVLCQGTVAVERGVDIEESKWLILCMQKFYNTSYTEGMPSAMSSEIGKDLRERRRQLVEQFSEGDSRFNIEDLLDQAERVG